MAKAGHYKELVEGYSLTLATAGITCTRKFIDSDPTANESLPDVGDSLDPLDEALKRVRVVSIQITKHGNVPTQQVYVVSYANTPGSSTGENPDDPTNTNPDELPISGALSAEAINIDGEKEGVKGKWVWSDGAKEVVDEQIFKKIITGSFKVSRRLANLDLLKWAQYSGKINNNPWRIGGTVFSAGMIMFEGVDYEEYFNSEGLRRYKVSFSFSIKAQQTSYDSSTYVGWNYNYDPKTGRFRKIIHKDNANISLYATANLPSLLSGAEAP